MLGYPFGRCASVVQGKYFQRLSKQPRPGNDVVAEHTGGNRFNSLSIFARDGIFRWVQSARSCTTPTCNRRTIKHGS